MNEIRVALIGGFYGSGKTSTIIQIGKKLSNEGKRVAIITNDRGVINVDEKVIKSLGFEGVDITGGCICFYLDRVSEVIDTIGEKFIPDLILFEPVAYFLPSKLFMDLSRELGKKLDVAPITILVDGPQLLQYNQEGMELPYIESRQIEDAEVVVINKIDAMSSNTIPVVEKMVQEINPRAKLITFSAKNGSGLDKLLDVILHEKHEYIPVITMTVMKKFAKSVTEIGERGEEYKIKAEEALTESQLKKFLGDLLKRIGQKVLDFGGEVSHLKVYIGGDDHFIKASLVRSSREVDFIGEIKSLINGEIVINTIVRGLPDDFLYNLIVKTINEKAPKYRLNIDHK